MTPHQPSLARTLCYGLFAAPLAFAALPLYVQWPAHAAGTWGMPLAVLGVLLLAVRVGDAFVDPWIGARIDRLFARSTRQAWFAAGMAGVLVAVGMTALMFAPKAVVDQPGWLVGWAAVALMVTSLGYSIAMVTHQAWAVRLGGGNAEQARWIGAREALALAGVIVASVLPSVAGWGAAIGVLGVLLVAAWWALSRVPPPSGPARSSLEPAAGSSSMGPAPTSASSLRPATAHSAARNPWRDPGFRRLMPVVLASGLASAIPASLVLLYVRDLLQAAGAAEGWLLGLYFAAAAAGMPLWVRAVRRFGLVRCWLAGMGLSIAAFAGAASLGPGDLPAFALICAASGFALGADLVVPPAMLADLIRRRATSAPRRAAPSSAQDDVGVEGLWFGWWNFTTKLTLAAAAGIALPLVQWLGYSPGTRDTASLTALAWCYALLPCAVKSIAALLLWMQRDAWPDARPGTHLVTEAR